MDGGFLLGPYNDFFPVAGLSVNAPTSGGDWLPGARGLYDPAPKLDLSAGSLAIVLPTEAASHGTGPAARMTSFFDDFYNRVYVDPQSINFGPVSTDSTVITRIWNAYYRQNVTLDSVTYDAALGLTVTGLVPPTVLKPLQQITYSVTALQDGPASFDSTLVWTFTLPWSYSQPVRGVRAKLWELAPNWPPSGKNYTLTYSFKTEIITSRSGREQRIALRSSPRRGLSYQVFLRKEALVAVNDLLRARQHLSFVMPELTRFVDSTGAMAVGASTLSFASLPIWAVPEAQVALSVNGAMEVRQIDSVAGTTVTFKTASTTHWPAGTRMYYGMSGYLGSKLSAPRETNRHARLELEFQVAPVTEPEIALPAAPMTLGGREVFLKRPNWANQVGAGIEHDVEELDYDRGPVARFTPVAFPRETRQLTFLGRTFAEMEEIREFFYRMKGQQGEFYMPTWEPDFVPKITTPAGTSNLRIAGTDFATTYGDSTVYRAIFVLMKDGGLVLRQVNTILEVIDGDGEDTFVNVTDPFDREITPDNIVMCGWMPAWRLSSDTLTIEWLTNTVAQTQITMQTVEDLTVETA